MAPKGSAFLYARPEVQARLEPLVVSWGYGNDETIASQFVDWHEWQGTRDMAAFLAVPDAIRFQAEHDWAQVRAECHALLAETLLRLGRLTGEPSFYPDDVSWYRQMAVVPLPAAVDLEALGKRLYAEHHIVLPVHAFAGQPLLRISVQGYNTPADLDALAEALGQLL